jgi:hypothetical protein
MKTYFVKSRTREIRPIVSKAYIVIHDADPEGSGIFPELKAKIDKSKPFAFMSKHSNLVYIKA